MVGYRDREEGGGNEEEREKRQRGFRFQVMKKLIGRLDTGQNLSSGKASQMTYEASKNHKNASVEWGHAVECLTK